MSRVASICFATVYVVLAFQPTLCIAADNSERSTGNKKFTVRDHRDTSSSPGGTKITNTPVVRDHRRAPVVRDHRTTPVIRDHRDPPIVRDHRTPPVMRDHRATSTSGGVNVTNSPIVRDHRHAPIVRDHRNPPIVRDHRASSNVNDPFAKTPRPGKAPPIVRPIDPGRGDGKVVVRDHRSRVVRGHRDTSNNSGGTKVTNTPIVRDHRDAPIVRDHRNAPIVRDHR